VSSLISLPLRLGIRTARASLQATRDLAELGLATLEIVGRALGEEPTEGREPAEAAPQPPEPEPPGPHATPEPPLAPEPPATAPTPPVGLPVEPVPPPAPPPPPAAAEPPMTAPDPTESTSIDIGLEPEEHSPDERELVEEFADPGAEDGAGASLRVAPPFQGYEVLRAPEVIAHLGSADLAELGETELYERTHRARRSVLEAIEQEIKQRGPA
jgi:outer membrane biosynthesis protein TonB